MKGSGSGNIGRSNNRKNRQQRQQQSHQGQQQSDDKQQSQSSHSSGQNGGQSLSKADIDSIASTMVKMQEDKKEEDSSKETVKMIREKVRMAVTSCEAETNEAIHYSGGFVDIVFEQPPAYQWIQSLPIIEYSDAELEEDASVVEGRIDTKETEGG
uniref:Uncharacterized protein n=1 Tax=Chromera velia CCMP2878 TaxID=1169474 RepID=A0A0G4I0C8_9ALVE|eukprot:Cvel_34333.t1-p1 / transcript=Cvel_34333.t1 / gene=Cvel_34333 / organism=Chromera_velia_CCMP2878 / gene_product=hypothetical protein / transcript_product=hypothetical protein / location=Cvel_scaffold5858:245-709(-) / protein_length=155 / sequence_SO=supercontig / SO=protein_coding / is_pseudo=false